MKIADVMTRDVHLIDPDESLERAAKLMAERDVGILPVGADDRLIGMLTDRDIAIRAVAEGKDPKRCKVREAMSDKVLYCYEDDDVSKASEEMERLEIRRLPIVNRDKRLVGIVSLANIAHGQNASRSGETLRSVAHPH